MVAKTEISAAYPHVSVKFLMCFANVMGEVASQLDGGKLRISVSSGAMILWPPSRLLTGNFSLAKWNNLNLYWMDKLDNLLVCEFHI
jgi:hypothetical protein